MKDDFRFLIYRSAEEDLSVNAVVKDDSIWLTQKAMAELFGVDRTAITKHLRNIFDEGELEAEAVCAKFAHTAEDGKTYNVAFYSLDAIISVGYRVNSLRATRFRIWATGVLKEFMIKGFALDDERLKNGRAFGKDFFRELLERVRSIRASERRIWLQITDIFAECSVDYDPKSPITNDFYAMVQNKFHYAIVGATAAEIVYANANRAKENMGLTTWKNSPNGRILKSDVTVAKNYLTEAEIRRLERLVSSFFDYIEDLIERENAFTMEAFAASVDKFLAFREYKILPDKGRISKRQADEKAVAEYDAFNKTQKIDSDFEKRLAAQNRPTRRKRQKDDE
jgi:hypothetical protein